MDGKLFVVDQNYTIGGPGGPQITEGKALAIQLGGYWIAGRIERGGSLASIEEDTVEEASEESFPASDPPAWSRTAISRKEDKPFTTTSAAYHFVADTDGNVCGLCPGMRVRTR